MERALEVGKAGEYLVCADLTLQGYKAFLSDQGLPYDVIVDVDGKLLKVQVKTTMASRMHPQRCKGLPVYFYHSRRCGKGGRKFYEYTDADIFAFVALDKKIIGYLPRDKVSTTMIFRDEAYRGKYQNELLNVLYKKIRRLHRKGRTVKEIAKKIGKSSAYVYRICNTYRKKDIKIDTYLTDQTFEKALLDYNDEEI